MKKYFSENNIKISTQQEKKFALFLDIFSQKNTQLNLSAIRKEEDIIEKHFVDSLILTNFVSLSGKVADLWTWGGFPGIPLKIWYGDDLDITFIDSVGKKVSAVEEFCKKLDLRNYECIQSRGEDLWKQQNHRESYDYVVTRAVAYLEDLLRYSFPLLKKWGYLIAYKLDNPQEIADAQISLKKYGGKVERVEHYELSGQNRCLIVIQKC